MARVPAGALARLIETLTALRDRALDTERLFESAVERVAPAYQASACPLYMRTNFSGGARRKAGRIASK